MLPFRRLLLLLLLCHLPLLPSLSSGSQSQRYSRQSLTYGEAAAAILQSSRTSVIVVTAAAGGGGQHGGGGEGLRGTWGACGVSGLGCEVVKNCMLSGFGGGVTVLEVREVPKADDSGEVSYHNSAGLDDLRDVYFNEEGTGSGGVFDTVGARGRSPGANSFST